MVKHKRQRSAWAELREAMSEPNKCETCGRTDGPFVFVHRCWPCERDGKFPPKPTTPAK